jgi:hypothetical protein
MAGGWEAAADIGVAHAAAGSATIIVVSTKSEISESQIGTAEGNDAGTVTGSGVLQEATGGSGTWKLSAANSALKTALPEK